MHIIQGSFSDALVMEVCTGPLSLQRDVWPHSGHHKGQAEDLSPAFNRNRGAGRVQRPAGLDCPHATLNQEYAAFMSHGKYSKQCGGTAQHITIVPFCDKSITCGRCVDRYVGKKTGYYHKLTSWWPCKSAMTQYPDFSYIY